MIINILTYPHAAFHTINVEVNTIQLQIHSITRTNQDEIDEQQLRVNQAEEMAQL